MDHSFGLAMHFQLSFNPIGVVATNERSRERFISATIKPAIRNHEFIKLEDSYKFTAINLVLSYLSNYHSKLLAIKAFTCHKMWVLF